MSSPSEVRTRPELAVDRIACTGHGICAGPLPDEVGLDEWGYPWCPRGGSTGRWAISPFASAPRLPWPGPPGGDECGILRRRIGPLAQLAELRTFNP